MAREKCKVCRKQIPSWFKERHKKQHSKNRQHKCVACHLRFSSQYCLSRHLSSKNCVGNSQKKGYPAVLRDSSNTSVKSNSAALSSPKDSQLPSGRIKNVNQRALQKLGKGKKYPSSLGASQFQYEINQGAHVGKSSHNMASRKRSNLNYYIICHICQKIVYKPLIDRHMTQHERNSLYKCSFCGLGFTSKEGLCTHKAGKICCNAKSERDIGVNKVSLKKHKANKFCVISQGKDKGTLGQKKTLLPTMEIKGIAEKENRAVILKKRTRSHQDSSKMGDSCERISGANFRECPICFKSVRLFIFKRHMKQHKRNRPYICSGCDLGFTYRHSLLTHKMYCDDVKKAGNQMGKLESSSFGQLSSNGIKSEVSYLKVNESVTSQETHSPKSFKKSSNMRYRECSICHTMIFKGIFKRHMYKHSANFDHACPSCDIRFRTEYLLKQHVSRKCCSVSSQNVEREVSMMAKKNSGSVAITKPLAEDYKVSAEYGIVECYVRLESVDSLLFNDQERQFNDERQNDLEPSVNTCDDKSQRSKGKPFKCQHCSLGFWKRKSLILHLSSKTCIKLLSKESVGGQQCMKVKSEHGQKSVHCPKKRPAFKSRSERPAKLRAATYTLGRKSRLLARPNGYNAGKSAVHPKKDCVASTSQYALKRETSISGPPVLAVDAVRSHGEMVNRVLSEKSKTSSFKEKRCFVCRQQYPVTDFESHMESHFFRRTFICPVCPLSFANRYNATRHMSKAHLTMKKTPCRLCSIKIRGFRELKDHSFVHHSEEMYKCLICNRKLKSHYYLKVHFEIHQKKMSNSVAAKIKREEILSNSRAKTRNTEVVSCFVCQEKFSHHALLRSHMKSHSPNEHSFSTAGNEDVEIVDVDNSIFKDSDVEESEKEQNVDQALITEAEDYTCESQCVDPLRECNSDIISDDFSSFVDDDSLLEDDFASFSKGFDSLSDDLVSLASSLTDSQDSLSIPDVSTSFVDIDPLADDDSDFQVNFIDLGATVVEEYLGLQTASDPLMQDFDVIQYIDQNIGARDVSFTNDVQASPMDLEVSGNTSSCSSLNDVTTMESLNDVTTKESFNDALVENDHSVNLGNSLTGCIADDVEGDANSVDDAVISDISDDENGDPLTLDGNIRDLTRNPLDISNDERILFQCSVCFERFACNSSLQTHMCRYAQDGSHVNPICKTAFQEKSLLQKHMAEQGDTCKPNCRCSVCLAVSKTVMETHISNTANLDCIQCSETFQNRCDLVSHMLTHSEIPPNTCEVCDLSFDSHSFLQSHLMEHSLNVDHKAIRTKFKVINHVSVPENSRTGSHEDGDCGTVSENKGLYTCRICKEVFCNNTDYLEHMQTHKILNYECEICGEEMEDPELFVSHVSSDTCYLYRERKETPYRNNSASEVDIESSENSLVVSNQSIYTRQFTWSCGLCSKRLCNRNEYVEHVSKHSKNDYECSVCRERLLSQAEFLLHLKTHGNNVLAESVCISNETLAESTFASGIIVNTSVSLPCSTFSDSEKTKISYDRANVDKEVESVNKKHLEKKLRSKWEGGVGKPTCVSKQGNENPLPHRTCSYCGKIFPSKSVCAVHVAKHSENDHKCNICTKRFISYKALSAHTHRSHKKGSVINKHRVTRSIIKPLMKNKIAGIRKRVLNQNNENHLSHRTCSYCGKIFNFKSVCIIHVAKHSENDHKCTNCSKRFINYKALLVHMRWIHKGSVVNKHGGTKSNLKPLIKKKITGFRKRRVDSGKVLSNDQTPRCKVCHERLPTYKCYYKHQRMHAHSSRNRCTLCSKKFRKRSFFLRHMKAVHPHIKSWCMHCSGNCRGNCKAGMSKPVRSKTKDMTDKRNSIVGDNGVPNLPNVFSDLNIGFDKKLNMTCKVVLDKLSKSEVMNRLQRDLSVRSNLHQSNKSTSSHVKSLSRGKVQRAPYICNVCGKKFGQYLLLERHLWYHKRKKKKCKVCCAMVGNLSRHMLVHKASNKHQCNFCKHRYASKRALLAHVHIHHRHKLESASEKGYSVMTGQTGLLKMSREDSSKWKAIFGDNLACPFCGKQCLLAQRLNIHLISHSKDMPFKCPLCPKLFHRLYGIKHHIQIVHAKDPSQFQLKDLSVTGKDLNEDMPYKCNVCESGFIYDTQLKIHLMLHNEKAAAKDKSSGVSNTRTDQKKRIILHKRKHRLVETSVGSSSLSWAYSFGLPDKSVIDQVKFVFGDDFKCPICKLKRVNVYRFEAHLITHSTDFPFKCPICFNLFRWHASCKRHIQSAHSVDPSQYQVASLSASKKDLSVDAPYKCNVCNKGFIYDIGIKIHEMLHGNETNSQIGHTKKEKQQNDNNNVSERLKVRQGSKKSLNLVCHDSENVLQKQKGQTSSNKDEVKNTSGKEIQQATTSSKNSPSQLKYFDEGKIVAKEDYNVLKSFFGQDFACPYCGEKWSNVNRFHKHLISHSEDYPFQCAVCETRFKLYDHLHRHMQNVHSVHPNKFATESLYIDQTDLPYNCNVCSMNFRYDTFFNVHQMIHDGKDEVKNTSGKEIQQATTSSKNSPSQLKYFDEGKIVAKEDYNVLKSFFGQDFACPYCGGKWSTVHRFHTHLISHSEDYPFQCAVCETRSKRYEHLHRHMQKVHSVHPNKFATESLYIDQTDLPYNCNVCSMSFRYDTFFNVHQMIHDGKDEVKNTSGKEIQQATTSSKNSPSQLKYFDEGKIVAKKDYNVLKSLFGENLACPLCGEKWSTISHFHQHLISHSEDYPFQCALCESRYKRYDKLKRHMQAIHSVHPNQYATESLYIDRKELPYSCDVCSMSFRYDTFFNVHQMIHDGKKAKDGSRRVSNIQRDQKKTGKILHNKDQPLVKPSGGTTLPPSYLIGSFGLADRSVIDQVRLVFGDNFKCPICKLDRGNVSLLESHLIKHSTDFPFKCPVCDKLFKSIFSVKTHIQSAHSIDPSQYQLASVSASGRDLTLDFPYKCSVCNKGFIYDIGIKIHEMLHGNKTNSQSGLKNERQQQKDSKILHNKDQPLVKPSGGTTLPPSYLIGSFGLADRSVIDQVRLVFGDNFKCPICKLDRGNVSLLESHLIKHSTDFPFKCPVCDKLFKSIFSVKTHIQSAHSIDPSQYQLARLTASGRDLTVDFPYKCSVCNKGFIYDIGIKIHEMLHGNKTNSQSGLKKERQQQKDSKNVNERLKIEQGKKESLHLMCQKGENTLQKRKRGRPSRINELKKTLVRENQQTTEILTKSSKKILPQFENSLKGKDVWDRKDSYSVYSTFGRNLVCPFCGEKWLSIFRFEAHLVTHSDDLPFKCLKCQKSFKRYNCIALHMEKAHSVNPSGLEAASLYSADLPYSCKVCGIGFMHDTLYEAHKMIHDGKDAKGKSRSLSIIQRDQNKKAKILHEEKQPLVKPSVGTSLPPASHMWSFGLADRSVIDQVRLLFGDNFKCPICKLDRGNVYYLESHLTRHSTDLPFKCPVCNKLYKSLLGLKTHIQSVHSVDPSRYQLASLTANGRDLTVDFPYKCGVCNKGFIYDIGIMIHEMLHGSERNRQSSESSSCSTLIGTNSWFWHNLNCFDIEDKVNVNKMKALFGDNFTCPLCGEKSVSMHNFEIHMITHSGDMPFKCPLCQKLFKLSLSVKEHLQEMHSSHPSEFELQSFSSVGRSLKADLPHKCSICDKGFLYDIGLEIHVMLHFEDTPTDIDELTEETAYECVIETNEDESILTEETSYSQLEEVGDIVSVQDTTIDIKEEVVDDGCSDVSEEFHIGDWSYEQAMNDTHNLLLRENFQPPNSVGCSLNSNHNHVNNTLSERYDVNEELRQSDLDVDQGLDTNAQDSVFENPTLSASENLSLHPSEFFLNESL